MIQLIRNIANKLVKKYVVKKEQLPRSRRRQIERIENEAKSNCDSLCQKFIVFLYETDNLTEDKVNDEIKTLSNRWLFYCKMKGLNKEVHSIVSNFCKDVYKTNKHLLN